MIVEFLWVPFRGFQKNHLIDDVSENLIYHLQVFLLLLQYHVEQESVGTFFLKTSNCQKKYP